MVFGNSKRGWIGVDLGQRAIKIAQLTRVRNRLCLTAAAVSQRGSIALGSVARTLRDDLRGATALAEGARGSRSAAVMTMQMCRVEPLEEDTIADPARCTDTWSAGPGAGYALSVGAEVVNSTVEDLARVGLQCEAIDGPPQAIARILRLTSGYQSGQLLGALDWGESSVTFLAVSDGQARYVRKLNTPGFAAVRSQVAEAIGLSESDADRAILRLGVGEPPFDAPEGRLVSDALRNACRPVMGELQRTMEHLGGKLRVAAPERLVVLGVAATTPGLPGMIGRSMGVRGERWEAEGIERDDSTGNVPDCLLAQAMSLSALAWEAGA